MYITIFALRETNVASKTRNFGQKKTPCTILFFQARNV